jgi:ribosomal protein S18 acetylase RimI-like enzyme
MTIPVQRLTAGARDAYRAHLAALDPDDTRLRFGSVIGRDAIAAYVDRIDFDRDVVFGVRDDALRVVGAAHLAMLDDGTAELGVSVDRDHRRRGMGGALVRRAAEHSRNRNVRMLYMHCLADNAAMMHIARRAGMAVVFESGHADAHLTLPPADPASLIGEALADGIALVDFTLKTRVNAMARIERALRPDDERK